MANIKVLIADDVPETYQVIERLLTSEEDIEVIGRAGNGDDAVGMAERLSPDVILLDIGLAGISGIHVAGLIAQRCPRTAVIFTSLQADPQLLREAMRAGGRDLLIKPFSREILTDTLRRVYEAEQSKLSNRLVKEVLGEGKQRNHQLVTVFSAKGGVGRTTLAVNLSVALAQKTGKPVALIDLDLQLGDVAIFMNLLPKKTWSELAQELDQNNSPPWEQYLTTHSSGVLVLASPSRPEYAEMVQASHVERTLRALKEQYEYVIVDTPPLFADETLNALDLSTQVLLLTALDLPAVKNTKLSLDVLESLHIKGKTKMLINRFTSDASIKLEDLESNMGFLTAARIPAEGKTVLASVNEGIPFVLRQPGARITSAINEVAQMVIDDSGQQPDLEEQRKKGLLKRWVRTR